MREALVTGNTLPEVYHKALYYLDLIGKQSDCADWNCQQIECGMTMLVKEPLKEPRISRLFSGGPEDLEQYRQEMLDGILDFEVDLGKWAYTYHRRIEDQIGFVIAELSRNPSSRRAVILVRDKQADMNADDPACLQHIQYFIREGKLDCDILFRSNDAVKATFMNAYALICLQERIAKVLQVEVGTYTHRANSFHCYEKDFDLLQTYCDDIDRKKFEELTYRQDGEFGELMEDAKAGIAAKVAHLKEL